ncbi:hypothetical protein [Bariatricus sp. SGI.019]|uniref:hypothetical protein n=1 Tax=Bariatricus sp. SGI.019 TaxID=3420548 RepID=UPI003D01CD8D
MVLESNTLEFLFLKDGEKGEPGVKGDDGKTLYTWFKYSQNADGSNMTDDPTDAAYVGISYNNESSTESMNPSDYNWTKIKGKDGDAGSDAYTIVLTNENISFATNINNLPLSNQSKTCEIIVLKGAEIRNDFTIGTITDVEGITTSISNHVITLSASTSAAITSDSGEISIPITVDGIQFEKVISFSVSKQGIQGESGDNAKSLDLYSSSYIVAFDSNSNLKDSSDIILTASQQNYDDGIIWSTLPSVTLGTVSGNTNQRTLSPSLFSTNTQIKITITSGELSDVVTIVKVQDGKIGEKGESGNDAYTIILSNESHIFAGNTTSALPTSTKCEVIAYKGTTQIPVTIGTISGLPIGMTAPISNNGANNPYFSPTVTSEMTTKSGTLEITITVDGKTFTKYFSYSLALQGEQGSNGISVSSVSVQYYQSTSATELIGGSWSTDRPTWEDGKYIWSKQITTLSNGTSSETDPVCITGGTGSAGATGRSIEDIVTEYYLSTSKTEQIGGSWLETQPDWSSGHYVWTRSKIIYSNPSSTEYKNIICDTTWESMQSQIDTITETMSGVEQKVDANTKSITGKVWQTDITNSINNYDNTTTKELRDRVTQTEADITGIQNTVSDVQTTLTTKADGSTVTELQKTVTENKQDADSFKTTVEQTYATKDSLNDYSTTEQVQSAIEQKAESILGTVTDSEGNTSTYQGTLAGLATQVKDAEGNITQLQQTSEEVSIKAGNAEKLALESKVLAVNLSVESMNVATDTDGNNGSYSNCKTSVKVFYGIEDVTAYSTITCTPSTGVTGSWNATSKVYTVSNMTVDNGMVTITGTYKVTIDGSEQTLTDTKTFSISKSKQGIVGSKGDKGESLTISSRSITYQRSSSGTNPPTGEWTETIPERTTGSSESATTATLDDNGVLTYSDGATLDDDGVLTVNNTDMQLSSDGTLSTALEDLKYLWTRTIVTYSDGTSTTSYSVSCDGDDGKGIKSTDITYQASSSGTSEPTGTWESSIPNVPEGSFLWTRTVYTYSDDTTSIAYSVSKIGKQGEQGISVKSITPEYYLSTSSTEVTGGNWVTIPPIKTNSTYIWKREHTIYEDNTESYSSAVLDQSLNELFNVTSELTVGQEEISAEIKDARGSYTSLKASLEGVKSTVTKGYTDAVNEIQVGGRNLLPIKIWENGHWWGSSTNENYKRTNITFPAGTYTFTKYNDISEYVDHNSPFIFIKYDSETNTGDINNLKSSKAYAGTQTFNMTYPFRIYIQNNITWERLNLILKSVKLEIGNKATDWTPAPEDIDNKIDTVESTINQRADNIELSVAQKENIPVTAVRYIRDWLNGIKGASSIDNKWVECDVITQGTNIASGIIPTYKNSSLTTLTVSNPEYYTDEMLLDEALERYISSTENSCLEIDLGDIYYNIDYIRVWHYYEDNRVYNHKMQISTDGISWVTIYDSDIAGGYAETSYGKVYYLNNAAIAENITSLNISSNQIESRVENIEGNFSSIKEQADKIESIVGSESENGATGLISSINNLDNLIVKLRSEYEQYKSDNGTSISTLTQTMNEITSRIATVEGNTRDISEIRQDAKGWQALFAQLDMYDMPEITTNISIDINGITVTNPTTKQQTRITIDEFSGWYNNEKIFWIDKDTTKTRRLLCEKGWDTGADFIKMTTNSYTYSDGRTLNGVAYVKSGGSS